MILVDASVWVQYLRDAPGPAADFVDQHLDGDLLVCEPVLMEVLAGTRSGPATTQVERLLRSQQWCGIDADLDFRGAVDVYQQTRSTGHQPRSLQDCLIAACSIRHGVTLAHRDVDFERIAGATGLRTVDLRG